MWSTKKCGCSVIYVLPNITVADAFYTQDFLLADSDLEEVSAKERMSFCIL